MLQWELKDEDGGDDDDDEALHNSYYSFDSSGEAPVKRLLSQLIMEDIDIRVGLEDSRYLAFSVRSMKTSCMEGMQHMR
jgi:hypothetical protein